MRCHHTAPLSHGPAQCSFIFSINKFLFVPEKVFVIYAYAYVYVYLQRRTHIQNI